MHATSNDKWVLVEQWSINLVLIIPYTGNDTSRKPAAWTFNPIQIRDALHGQDCVAIVFGGSVFRQRVIARYMCINELMLLSLTCLKRHPEKKGGGGHKQAKQHER